MEYGIVDTPFEDRLATEAAFYTLSIAKTPGTILLGVVSDGEHAGSMVSLNEQAESHDFDMLETTPADVTFVATLSTPFTETGHTYVLRYGGDTGTLGFTFQDNAVMNIQLTEVPGNMEPKRKQQMKQVMLGDGRTLNREGTMRAVVAWLNTMNATHAIKHGVARLVWCKENTRTGGSLQRTFYYTDLHTKRQKPCANATAALELMHELTGEDFYEDMKTKGHLFVSNGPTPIPMAVRQD